MADKIAAIGTVTKESKTAIEEARAAYNALTDSQKLMVENLQTLEKAEAELKKLNEKSEGGDTKPDSDVKTGDKGVMLYAGLSVAALLGLAVIPAVRRKKI